MRCSAGDLMRKIYLSEIRKRNICIYIYINIYLRRERWRLYDFDSRSSLARGHQLRRHAVIKEFNCQLMNIITARHDNRRTHYAVYAICLNVCYHTDGRFALYLQLRRRRRDLAHTNEPAPRPKVNKINAFSRDAPIKLVVHTEYSYKFNYAVKPWSVATRRKSEEHTLGSRPQFFSASCMTGDVASCRNLCGEHASAWIHRIRAYSCDMSHQHSRARAHAPRRVRASEAVSVRARAHRFCIFQADNLSILSTPIPPQIPFSLAGTAAVMRAAGRKSQPVYDRSLLAGK